MASSWRRLRSWEGLLLAVLIVVIGINATQVPFYLRPDNQINLFELYIEEIIVALAMTFVIINGEIDLSVASMMALAACVLAFLYQHGVPMPLCIIAGLLVGIVGGAFNGFWVAIAGLPSLVVTLAGLIMFRGLARVLVEDRSVGSFPEWFNQLGQQPFDGLLPFALILFFLLLIIAIVVLQFSGFGRYVFVIGNNREVARYSGVQVRRVKMTLFMVSGLVSALAGILLAARLGSVRGDTATGFELDVITMVLLGGVSIFGGSGTLYGVLLSIMLVLNIRNGMTLQNITGNTQTGVIGTLLILSVFIPNILSRLQEILNRRRLKAIKAMTVEKANSS